MKHKVILLLIFWVGYWSQAQCAMCRAVLESEAGQNSAKGINDGIIYLMIIPYVLVGGIALLVYKSLKSNVSK